ncbi:MAG: response regulator [Thermoanaerobaculia bacterium]
MTRAGLACDEAAQIEEAEELMDLHDYDLLVLDRRLPDGEGLDVCRQGRKKGFTRSILMLTALDDAPCELDEVKFAAQFVVKPPWLKTTDW